MRLNSAAKSTGKGGGNIWTVKKLVDRGRGVTNFISNGRKSVRGQGLVEGPCGGAYVFRSNALGAIGLIGQRPGEKILENPHGNTLGDEQI